LAKSESRRNEEESRKSCQRRGVDAVYESSGIVKRQQKVRSRAEELVPDL
jgi:hypothetical protein